MRRSQEIYNLTDSYGRTPRYIRLSVTDRCNLGCLYCVNGGRQKYIPHERILRYEEFYRLASILHQFGARKFRITGGEPFARKGIMDFLAGFRARFPDTALAVTTNGTLLDGHMAELSRLGLASFNISLDSFRRDTFFKLTGQDALPRVLAAIEGLLKERQRVKINAVAFRGITDQQMPDFIHAIRNMPVDLRFIEFMPMGSNTVWNDSNFISWRDLLKLAREHGELAQSGEPNNALDGPARIYELKGAPGRLGFISAISDHFCHSCQRLRITSDGKLRTCLFADKEIELARLLRNPKIHDAHIARAIASAFQQKPIGATLLAARRQAAVACRQMVGIGG